MSDTDQFKIESNEDIDFSSDAKADMDADIEFGQVEHTQPDPGLRPDQDKHFAVSMCGDVGENDLPIFVDMDVMRDMEAHARENTRVELGGVMLGNQHVDSQGNPFVVITDSLRAKHYEATKGSFKFTHETWSQITRERNEFKKDLEMVGWYHTHPGWGVFLSGMDLFICNNFFSRPLDVALVVDPCAGDRGWFQWNSEGETRQTPGFYLITNRHRQRELNHFSDIFSNQNPAVQDPRFRQASFQESGFQQGESMVNVIDNRRPVFELAIVSMLFLQLLLAAVFGYRLLGDATATNAPDEVGDRLAAVESQINEESSLRDASIKEQAMQQILSQIVDRETGTNGLVEKFGNMAVQNKLMSEDLEGFRAQLKLAAEDKASLAYNLRAEKNRSTELQNELRDALSSMTEMSKLNDQLSAESGGIEQENAAIGAAPSWLLYAIGGIGLFVLGIIGGSWFTRRSLSDFEDGEDDFAQYSESSSNRPAASTKTNEAEQPVT